MYMYMYKIVQIRLDQTLLRGGGGDGKRESLE